MRVERLEVETPGADSDSPQDGGVVIYESRRLVAVCNQRRNIDLQVVYLTAPRSCCCPRLEKLGVCIAFLEGAKLPTLFLVGSALVDEQR